MGKDSDVTEKSSLFPGENDFFSLIGDGDVGGKAKGLITSGSHLLSYFKEEEFDKIQLEIPRFSVITTSFYDEFIKINSLPDLSNSDLSDERIVHHFLNADFPVTLNGKLRQLISDTSHPLAVRSSSLMEDALKSPFAGVYKTKMIPNHQPDPDKRFHQLADAVKYVYASTFFKDARSYRTAIGADHSTEKMAVIIQEIAGSRHNRRFYPNISGVSRSYNFYPTGHASPDDGVINLALGLGKTIVDGGHSWIYSPAYPAAQPPYGSARDLLNNSQARFWAVNMGATPPYDPVKETEYMIQLDLTEAEYDNTISLLASTYDHESDQIRMGTGNPGPRIITFAPILSMDLIPLNHFIKELTKQCEKVVQNKVEIEFAVTITSKGERKAVFSFLQVRPMMDLTSINVQLDQIRKEDCLVYSENVMGNGEVENIDSIVMVDPEFFDFKFSRQAAMEIEQLNQIMLQKKKPYLLIGFGRWGSSDPWLGIPVNWGQISGVKAIVESTKSDRVIDMSQGSHFFHNMNSLSVLYFSIEKSESSLINWEWLKEQKVTKRLNFCKILELSSPLHILVDGRKRSGVIYK